MRQLIGKMHFSHIPEKENLTSQSQSLIHALHMQLSLPIFNDPDAKAAGERPGIFIQAELDKRGWGQAALAEIIGRPLGALNEVIKGKRPLTPEIALALAQAFDQSPELWVHREAAYRLSLVRNAPDDDTAKKARLFEAAPVKDLQRRDWISSAAESADEIEAELTRFLGENPLTEAPVAVARKSEKFADFSNAQRAWLMQSSHLARRLNARAYTKQNLEAALPQLRKLAVKPEFAARLPIALAEVGVRFVIIEDLPRTKIDGAAFFLDNDPSLPVIALSIRIDRMDSFWHTVGHELRHIINEDPLSLDADLVGNDRVQHLSDIESRADKEAAEWLISSADIKSFSLRAKPLFLKDSIRPFAGRMGVHPSIVVGSLNHMGVLDWNRHADLRPKIREHVISTAICDGYGRKPLFNLI
jgi:HTH-type transcriptional regulator/antitoxin HigA